MDSCTWRPRLLAGLLAILPLCANAAEKLTEPVDVTVVNPVLPVEVSNADPIAVVVSGGSASVPYFHSATPTCPFGNQCLVTFPAVPAGKRLRLTSISGVFFNTNVSGVAVLNLDVALSPRLAVQVSPYPGAYYGTIISFNEAVEFYFEAGQQPNLEFGIGAGQGGISVDARNRLTVSGQLVDAAP